MGFWADPITPGKLPNWLSDAHTMRIIDENELTRKCRCVTSRVHLRRAIRIRIRVRPRTRIGDFAAARIAHFPPRSTKRKTNERLRVNDDFRRNHFPWNCRSGETAEREAFGRRERSIRHVCAFSRYSRLSLVAKLEIMEIQKVQDRSIDNYAFIQNVPEISVHFQRVHTPCCQERQDYRTSNNRQNEVGSQRETVWDNVDFYSRKKHLLRDVSQQCRHVNDIPNMQTHR
jgi:hypothetical protein